MLEEMERIPGDARTMIGFMTYDQSIHFYNLDSDLSQPQMLIVSDVEGTQCQKLIQVQIWINKLIKKEFERLIVLLISVTLL